MFTNPLTSTDLRTKYLWAAAIGVLAITIYVALGLSPSSYAMGLRVMGIEPSGLWLGQARQIRSDEWMVLTPYIQIAVANDLQGVNTISPYREILRSFQALPIKDWAMLFKPYYWGFLLLPPANAYSLYFATMSTAFIAGWSIFLRQMRATPIISLVVATTLYFSPFVQVWWTSNAGAFALAPWVAVCWLHFDNRFWRIGTSTYALTVWLLSCAYPPFLYASGVAMAVLIIAFRSNAVTRARLFDATVAGAIALALFITYFHELIDIMQNTVYPGRRQSIAGGVEWAKLFAHFNPSLTTRGFEPLAAFVNSNACEITVMSTLIPLYAATLIDGDAWRHWAWKHRPSLLVIGAGLGFFGCWIFLPLPAIVGKATGLFMVPPSRAVLGLGLILNLAAAVILSQCGARLSTRRLAALALLTVAGILAKLAYGDGSVHGLYSWKDAVPLLCLGLLVLIACRVRRDSARTKAVLTVALLGNLLTYGLFNPIQSAYPIFSLDREQVRQNLQQRGAATDANGVIVAPGHYGALIAGAGLPSINHVLYYPQLDFFKRHFSEMSDEQFQLTFNRYAHISVGDTEAPVIVGADHIAVPASAFVAGALSKPKRSAPQNGDPLQIHMLNARPVAAIAQSVFGHVDSISPWENGQITLQGWLHAPIDDSTKISVWTSASPSQSSAIRMLRPDVAAAVDPALGASGIRLTVRFAPGVKASDLCLLVEQKDRSSTVRFPDGRLGCTSVH
ncbi:DUF7657 domain-containing protein [Xanthomonas bonasiae]|uniref:DUF7657 domain-containing protein n=1 Tax=Xanthomonas bonasiae TaxID=2810351 RepID=UPI00177B6535|nr:hypothetical protein [Xanthomonas surreyensis]MBD7922538.1 hypothetical protein [Xanthomonas surreyensis]